MGEPEKQFEAESLGIVGRTPWQLFWRRFKKDKWAIAGGFVIGFMILLALLAPLAAKVAGHPPDKIYAFEGCNEFGLPNGPNGDFWFGTSANCGDLFVQIMYGTRTSLTVAFAATAIEVGIGLVLGLAAGFYRGKTDTFISRSSDVVLAMPVLLLALGLVSACGLTREGCLGGLLKPGMLLVALVIGLFSWPYMARIIRGQVLTLREKEFVEAARSIGSTNRQLMFKEILPNIMAPLIVYTTLMIPTNVLFEAALSFLGVGVPPNVPSWGRMLEEGSSKFATSWWLMFFPGLFILALTLAFNLLGDGMRDALDTKTVDA